MSDYECNRVLLWVLAYGWNCFVWAVLDENVGRYFPGSKRSWWAHWSTFAMGAIFLARWL